MKKILAAMLLLTILLPVSQAFAVENVTVTNYFYAHANTAGTFAFKDKYGSTVQYGDGIEHDATITALYVTAQGMAEGDKIQVVTDLGETIDITPGVRTSIVTNEAITIRLVKVGNNEVLARLDDLWTYDQANGGTEVHYSFGRDYPTSFGDLGPGGNDAEDVEGNYYYFSPRDAYKYDYTVPSGSSYYELHYLNPDGSTAYMREYNQTPTGVHYLTCNGTYQMRWFDSPGGTLIAQSELMTTTGIQDPTCSSYAGTGYDDFDVTKTVNDDGTVTFEWQKPSEDTHHYDVYVNGNRVPIHYTEETSGRSYTTVNCNQTLGNICDNPISFMAVKEDGNIVGQVDFTGTPSSGGGGDGGSSDGCDGCALLTDMLACPAWDEYMGDWRNLLNDVIPPPPDWQEVANIMRDTIVPAMGQELVNRAPVIADIIADEFESRESPVYPPGSLPTYTAPEPLPTMTDMTTDVQFDLNSGVPSFEPDYSGSQSFTIPDPMDLELSDDDAGYVAPQPTPSEPNRSYQGQDVAPEPDPGYAGSASDDVTPPGYTITNPDATAPARDYVMGGDDGGPIPGYVGSGDDPGTAPGYDYTDAPMPDYTTTIGGG